LAYWYSTFKDNGQNSTITAEVSGHANTALVVGFLNANAAGSYDDIYSASTWSSIIDLLAETKSRGMRALLSIPIWGTYGDGNTNNCPFANNWQARLNAFAQNIQPYVLDGTIAAFIVIDEPLGVCVQRAGDVITYAKTNPIIGGLPYWVNMHPDNYTGAWPTGVDWVSTDLYTKYGYTTDFSLEVAAFNHIKSRLGVNQRMVLIPEAWSHSGLNPTTSGGLASWDGLLELKADLNFELAKDSSVVAIVPFIWRLPNSYGVSDLPRTKQRYVTFGQQFLGR
jgi:hypothetical protein